jgi:hypothetical protein
MGAFSKEFWITIAACIPVIMWALMIAQSRGQGVTIPAIQSIVLAVGVLFIWREGERISEAATRVWEKINPTRVWDSAESVAGHQAATNTSTGENVARYPPPQTLRQIGERSDHFAPPLARNTAPNVSCPYCGYSIQSQAVFCRRCGRKQ